MPDHDLEQWLELHGLSRYAETLRQNGVDRDVLPEMSEADFKELGVSLGDRKRFLKAIRDHGAPGAGVPAAADVSVGAGSARPTERRRMTIMFCDLVGSTQLAGRLDPEELGELMVAYQRACQDVVERWDGHIAQFLGDGAVVFFGWPRAHEDDAQRAVHAALELNATIGRIKVGPGEPLQARAGVATGLVIVGRVMAERFAHRDDVVGETPNLAARLQSEAPPGGVVIAPETRKLVGDRFRLQSLGVRSLRGMPGPVEIWAVLGTQTGRSRFEARAGGYQGPLVGRGQELAALVAAWAACVAGQGGAVLLQGEPGIGKSRLLQVLLDDPATLPGTTLRLNCSPYHSNTPLFPFLEWLRSSAEISAESDPETQADRLSDFVSGLGVDPTQAVPLLASHLAIPLRQGAYPSLTQSPQLQRERTIHLLSDIIARFPGSAAAILTIEDIHWADPTTLAVIDRLMSRLASSRMLLIGTARTAFDGPFGDATTQRLPLARLDPRATMELVGRLAGEDLLSESLVESVLESSDGVPLFVEELTRALIEAGAGSGGFAGAAGDSQERGGRLTLGADSVVPHSLHDLLVARLDRLAVGREVAQLASVLGRSFPLDLLTALQPERNSSLADDVEYLCEAGIFDPVQGSGGAQYAFRHALVRDAAYQSQLKSRRREAHARVADVLERTFPIVSETEPALLALHHLRARQPLQASHYLLAAGRSALHVCATQEAITHLSQGLEAIANLPKSPERDRNALRLQATLGTSYMQARSWAAEEAVEAYQAAAELSHAAESQAERIWVMWGAWVAQSVRGRMHAADKARARISALATDGDVESRIVAEMIAVQGHFYMGRFRGARESADAFANLYDPVAHGHLTDRYSIDLDLVCRIHDALAAFITGDVEGAGSLSVCARVRTRELDHPYSVAWANIWGSLCDLLAGRYQDVLEAVERGRIISRENGYAYVDALGTMLTGCAIGLNGDPNAGVQTIDRGLGSFLATGAEIVVPFFETVKAELLVANGSAGRALALLQEAEVRIDRWGEAWQAPEVHRVKAKALTLDGASDPVIESTYRRALELSRDQGSVAWELRACSDYSAWLDARQRGDEGVGLLNGILARYQKGAPHP